MTIARDQIEAIKRGVDLKALVEAKSLVTRSINI
jgi:hypothetical protein